MNEAVAEQIVARASGEARPSRPVPEALGTKRDLMKHLNLPSPRPLDRLLPGSSTG
jgi:hypothetical protein